VGVSGAVCLSDIHAWCTQLQVTNSVHLGDDVLIREPVLNQFPQTGYRFCCRNTVSFNIPGCVSSQACLVVDVQYWQRWSAERLLQFGLHSVPTQECQPGPRYVRSASCGEASTCCHVASFIRHAGQ